MHLLAVKRDVIANGGVIALLIVAAHAGGVLQPRCNGGAGLRNACEAECYIQNKRIKSLHAGWFMCLDILFSGFLLYARYPFRGKV